MSPVPEALTWLLCVLLAAILYFRNKHSRLRTLGDKLDGPRALPIIGNILDLGSITSSKHAQFQTAKRILQEYQSKGNITRMWMGPYLVVLLSDPVLIEDLLNSDELDKSELYALSSDWLGDGLVTAPGKIWKKNRKLLNPTFHSTILENFVDSFTRNAQIMVEKLRKESGGPEFDIFQYCESITLDIICETAMGVTVNAQEDSNSEYLKALTLQKSIIMARLVSPWLYPDVIFSVSPTGREQKRVLGVINDFKQTVLEAKKQELKRRREEPEAVQETGNTRLKPFLELLLEASGDGKLLSDKQIKDEVATFMTAGQDTTSSGLGFSAFALATNQDVQDKALEEQRAIFGHSDRAPTSRDLTKMVYLERVIKETLRLYPPAILFARTLRKDMELGGNVIPAGANVGVCTVTLHRHEKLYPDPLRFDPDRFLPENIAQRHPYAYLLFSGGRRNCIGQRYAMMEMKAVLSILLRHYQLIPGSKTTLEEDLHMNVILTSASGINVRIIPRMLKKGSNEN